MSSEHHHGAQRRDRARPPTSAPWVDQDVQQLRPYVVVTDGHAHPRYEIRLDTVLTATTNTAAATAISAAGTATEALAPEAAHAIGLCRAGGCSVAEIAATIRQPVLVTKTLLCDLIEAGALGIASPAVPTDSQAGRPSTHLLQALLEGLEAHEFAVA
ncbi:DUF742 domain-containing protein [Actinomadura sp. NPDC023710]|uniref:DUF742 domain-containing protein n=1 Tax=Actinomadura sp. NPDC023710 TaxID=3158219 RepID=UPI0033E39440